MEQFSSSQPLNQNVVETNCRICCDRIFERASIVVSSIQDKASEEELKDIFCKVVTINEHFNYIKKTWAEVESLRNMLLELPEE